MNVNFSMYRNSQADASGVLKEFLYTLIETWEQGHYELFMEFATQFFDNVQIQELNYYRWKESADMISNRIEFDCNDIHNLQDEINEAIIPDPELQKNNYWRIKIKIKFLAFKTKNSIVHIPLNYKID